MAESERAWTALCLALVAAVAIVDALLGGGLEGVLVVGPVVASARLSPRRTTFVAVLAVGCGLSIAIIAGQFGHLDVSLRLVASFGLSVLCISLARTRQGREQRLERLARLAEIAQHAILPPIPARVGHLDFATRYLSATEDALLGGDLYDVVATDDRVHLIIGDVRGKGLDAIRLAVVVLGLFRRAAVVESGLEEVAKAVDSAIGAYLGEEDFVTAVFVELTAGQVSVVNCGHHPPLRIRPHAVEELHEAEPSPPLGLGPHFTVETHSFDPGDRLLVYTDGLIEARSPSGTFFDLDRLPDGFLTQAPLEATLDMLVKRLVAHVGGRINDDMALVLTQPVNPAPRVQATDREHHRSPVDLSGAP